LLPPLILILGGARSGKSAYAETLAGQLGQSVLYIATAEAKDQEMAERIMVHRQARPPTWDTLEAPQHVAIALAALDPRPDAILLDCLTLLVSNMMLAQEGEPPDHIETAVLAEIEAILAVQVEKAAPLIVVSNEVGLGVVPPSRLGRLYRDLLGRANQQLAARADQVIFMVAGLPLTVKGSP